MSWSFAYRFCEAMGKVVVLRLLADSTWPARTRPENASPSLVKRKPAWIRLFMLGLGVAWLTVSTSGCMCIPMLVAVAAFPLTGVAIDLTHPSIDGTHSNLIRERQKQTEAKQTCEATGAPPDYDCVPYEMQGVP
jgi:hypothetical protein